MHMTMPRSLPAACAALALAAAAAHAQETVPEAGRWITASGNVEVEIAPCGPAYCGTITRVIANNSMSMPGTPMAGTSAGAASPLGKKILFDLVPAPDGGWQGRIYNRENGKTYEARLAAVAPDQLKLTIYADTPGTGDVRVQVWRRPAVQAAP